MSIELTNQPVREVAFGEHLTRREQLVRSLYTSGPGLLWILTFLCIPLTALVVISFMSRGTYGGVQLPFTLENYWRFFGFGELGFEPLYPFIILRSLALALSTTVICTLLGLPLAFFIAGLAEKYKNLALTLVMIPFWSNLLIRTYAWQMLFSAGSPLARLAEMLGLIQQGEAIYPGTFAVHVGMLCDYLPYLVLPLYTSVEKLDWSLAEAAMDLGADRKRVFWFAVLPQIIPGLAAGIVLVFVPATGTFVIPDLLGGARTVLLGSAIAQQFGPSRDWPFGSAIALFGMAALLLGLWLHARITRASERMKA
jgi:spermidine/putrescine transport system permease protein